MGLAPGALGLATCIGVTALGIGWAVRRLRPAARAAAGGGTRAALGAAWRRLPGGTRAGVVDGGIICFSGFVLFLIQ
eukprot:2620622-Alexandrium_andersonii.AAC.1